MSGNPSTRAVSGLCSTNLCDMILTSIGKAAALYPQRTAIRMKGDKGYEEYSYRDLLAKIASLANALAGQGIGKGDRVALLSENRPEWMIAYLAVVALGAVIVPLDAQYTDKETALLLDSSEAKAVFVSAAARAKLPSLSAVKIISFDPREGIDFQKMLRMHPEAALPAAPAADTPAALLYTSGTTGDPKGVILSHGNLAANSASLTKLHILKPEDNILCVIPLYHTYPSMLCMLLPLGTGTTVTILNSLKGADIAACMRETGVSIMAGVPRLYALLRNAVFDEFGKRPAPLRLVIRFLLAICGRLRRAVGVNIGKYLFGMVHKRFGPALRIFASGGARLEPDIYTDMFKLGFTVIEGYGLTETSPVCTFNPLAGPKAGSIGIPIPDVEVRIVNPDKNGHGELAVRGPNVMCGYYKKPVETAAVIRDGWFYTGDLGFRDAAGYFFITGRAKEVIVLPNGVNIFPEELEAFYKQIPAVKELCLIQTSRGLEAAVVPDFEYLRKMNLSNSREVIGFALEDFAKNLPSYKRIAGFKVFKDSLPATRLGKLKRGFVAELYGKSSEGTGKEITAADAQLMETPVAQRLLACLTLFSAQKNIVPDDNLELDLGLDSLARVELVASLEKSFGLELPDAFGSEIFTVKDAVTRLGALLSSYQPQAAEQARQSWAEILRQEPEEGMRGRLKLEAGLPGKIGQYLLKGMLDLFFIAYHRLSVQGLDNLPDRGPFIIAPNHLSLADGPAVMAALPRRIAAQTFSLGTSEFFGGPLTAKLAKLMQVIPVDIESRLQGALLLAAYVLRKGKILCIFPEGGRSRDGNIKEFKKGVGIIAGELKIPLVPAAIKGTYEALPTGRNFPRPALVTVKFGKAFHPGDLDYDGIVRKLHEEVVKLL